jgi:CDP-diacylglycerol---glycerol-3-phosphate 3-phosphatidyltransferase
MTTSAPPTRTPRFDPGALVTPANALTVVRMALTPVVLVLMASLRFDLGTFALWFVLCWTDYFDGILARRFGTTRSGAFLDPLADKFMNLGGMIVLVVKGVYAWPWVALIAAREIAITIYRTFVGTKGISMPARKSAKWKTFTQQSAVGFSIMPWVGIHASWVGISLLLVSVALTLISGAQYVIDGRKGRITSGPAAAATSAAK